MHIFFKFVVFYLLSPFIICSFPFSSPFMEFGIQIIFKERLATRFVQILLFKSKRISLFVI